MGLANFCAFFPVANVSPIGFGGPMALLVERFDRIKDCDGNFVKLHQEDFCQRLGRKPEDKYGSAGGIETIDIARHLISLPNLDKKEIEKFIIMSIFNFCVGNGDDHAKNFALLEEGNNLVLAPAYDIVSVGTIKFMSKTGKHIPGHFSRLNVQSARKFGNNRAAEKLKYADLRVMGQLFEIDSGWILNSFLEIGEKIKNAIPDWQEKWLHIVDNLNISGNIRELSLSLGDYGAKWITKRSNMLCHNMSIIQKKYFKPDTKISLKL